MVELPNEFSSNWCKYKETVIEVAGRKETLYSPRNDPDPEMIPTFLLVDPEMIPKELGNGD